MKTNRYISSICPDAKRAGLWPVCTGGHANTHSSASNRHTSAIPSTHQYGQTNLYPQAYRYARCGCHSESR
jgi:hypothetical protein